MSAGSFTSQGDGWWQASDGLWYPPEATPDWDAAAKDPAPGLSRRAVVAFVLSMVGFLGLLASIPGVVLGFQARRMIRESDGKQTGSKLAAAAIVIGFIWIGLAVAAAVSILSSDGLDGFRSF